MLTPAEATPRALAFLTLSHEMYGPQGSAMDDDEIRAVLSDDDGDIDWQSIATALGMIGHLLIDIIPETLYDASEEALTRVIAKHFDSAPDAVRVTISNRLTGTALLRLLSLRVMSLDA